MRTHFLNFRESKEIYKVKVSEDFFNNFMNRWMDNPTYPEKLEIQIDAREQCGMVFSMANFSGCGGRLPQQKKIQYHIAPPDNPDEQEKRKKMIKRFREKWKSEGKEWASDEASVKARARVEREKKERRLNLINKVKNENKT